MGNNYLDFKSKEKIAIIDANNFYVSCERLFQPGLDSKATVVLSNNDGCIIARSPEIKQMGIKMGQPLFKLDEKSRGLMKKFSSNYELYGDISDRITTILKRLVPKVEIYSIDESFLDLSHIEDSRIFDEIKSIQSTIQRLTGIPVSIGVAPNKTMAKLCNHLAKTQAERKGLCSYWDLNQEVITNLSIEEVWGIGRNYKKRLNNLNVETVGDFLNLKPGLIKQTLGINGLKTWFELKGNICHKVSTKFKVPKAVTCSRSFGSSVWEKTQMKNAIWTFLKISTKKLLKEKLDSTKIQLFASTNPFEEDYFFWSKTFLLEEQTNSLEKIWNQVCPIIDQMPNSLWSKAGVNLSGLRPNNIKQEKLIKQNYQSQDTPEVEYKKWETKRDFISQRYTTSWDDLPLVF